MADFNEYKGVWVFCEQRQGALMSTDFELVSEARKLADELGCEVTGLLLGDNVEGIAKELGGYGADRVMVCDSPLLKDYTTDAYAKVVCDMVNEYKPEVLLIGATNIGRDLGPRCAARLHTGLCADCTHLDVDVPNYIQFLRESSTLDVDSMKWDMEDRNLKMTRPAFGGHLMATIICPRFRPCMATVRPGVMKKNAFDEAKANAVEIVKPNFTLTAEDIHTDVTEVVKAAKKLVDLIGADFIVSVGRGISKDVEGGIKLAEELAAELGVDVSKLDVQGRVMKADVLAAAGVGAAAAPAAEAAAAVESNDEKPVKVNPLRRSIAANMTNSWHTSPRVTYTRPVEVTAMKDLRAKLKDGLKEQGIKLTYNHILMKVVAKALTEFPDVNASFADNMLTRHKHVNMGLAVAKGDGLIVPNVKNCEEKSLAQIAQETEALIEATRTGKLGMEDMTGGTFTISSLGPYGITSFSPIINQPELAILGVCDMVDTPVVRNGEIRTMMNLSLTADHRVIDGVMASKFLKRIAELLENPYMLLV